MFAVTGLLMLPSGLITIVPDSALTGRTVKAKANNPKNKKVTIRLETILLKFYAFFGISVAWFANKTFETNFYATIRLEAILLKLSAPYWGNRSTELFEKTSRTKSPQNLYSYFMKLHDHSPTGLVNSNAI